MAEQMLFSSRPEFRTWLDQNCLSEEGIWLIFGKRGGPKTIKASEALEEALCFGWIDGQMESIDGETYRKYFARRRKRSPWSDRNKKLAADLEERGLMTESGRAKIREAKESGTWDAPKPEPFTEEHMHMLESLLKEHELAYSNFMKMPLSQKKAYTGSYFTIKSEDNRRRRLEVIVERLNRNLNPMEKLK